MGGIPGSGAVEQKPVAQSLDAPQSADYYRPCVHTKSGKAPFFPRWADDFVRFFGLLAVGGLVYMVWLLMYSTQPLSTMRGYMPDQPIPYSHKLHAGELGIDCRYCHVGVEKAASASIPPTSTCMNCHSHIKTTSDKLIPVRNSFATGMPVEWKRVHDIPDFAYFNHSAHISKGVGCASCHGRIDKMEVVWKEAPMNMGWCLECHRRPEQFLRPKDQITNMAYGTDLTKEEQWAKGVQLREEYKVNPRTSCSTCHR
jgi:hypothetical protein